MKRISLFLMMAILAAASIFAAGKPIVVVWYPNNSSEDFKAGRAALDALIEKATGRPVVDKLTTDYVIAIEAIASGNAALCYPGAVGYIQASMKNPKVVPVVTASSASGTLEDSVYYSRIAVRTEDAPKYASGKGYALDGIKGKTMSFVSTSSTSGFLFPSSLIKSYFAKQMKWKASDKVEDLFLEGGADKFFSQVIFGQSHQGSIYNVLARKADVCAVDDIDVDSYFDLVSGKASTPGAVYVVKKNADAPFDTLPGASFTVLASSPVKQAPLVANMSKISAAEFKAIRTLLCSEETANNPLIFTPAGYKDASGAAYKGMWKKTANERFLPVDAAWYDDIRAMMR
jgi:phosphonate transport system substrate-binding protein